MSVVSVVESRHRRRMLTLVWHKWHLALQQRLQSRHIAHDQMSSSQQQRTVLAHLHRQRLQQQTKASTRIHTNTTTKATRIRTIGVNASVPITSDRKTTTATKSDAQKSAQVPPLSSKQSQRISSSAHYERNKENAPHGNHGNHGNDIGRDNESSFLLDAVMNRPSRPQPPLLSSVITMQRQHGHHHIVLPTPTSTSQQPNSTDIVRHSQRTISSVHKQESLNNLSSIIFTTPLNTPNTSTLRDSRNPSAHVIPNGQLPLGYADMMTLRSIKH
jgi:hypothetical protein